MALPMHLLQKDAQVSWPIGRTAGGNLDVHPGRINSIGHGFDEIGRQGLVVEIVTLVQAQEKNGGGTYPKIRKILERFVYPRTLVPQTTITDAAALAAFDAVDIDALYETASTAGLDYMASQPALPTNADGTPVDDLTEAGI